MSYYIFDDLKKLYIFSNIILSYISLDWHDIIFRNQRFKFNILIF